VPDAEEGCFADADSDGVPDRLEDNTKDADSDGIPDVADPDADGDGTPDANEGVSPSPPPPPSPPPFSPGGPGPTATDLAIHCIDDCLQDHGAAPSSPDCPPTLTSFRDCAAQCSSGAREPSSPGTKCPPGCVLNPMLGGRRALFAATGAGGYREPAGAGAGGGGDGIIAGCPVGCSPAPSNRRLSLSDKKPHKHRSHYWGGKGHKRR